MDEKEFITESKKEIKGLNTLMLESYMSLNEIAIFDGKVIRNALVDKIKNVTNNIYVEFKYTYDNCQKIKNLSFEIKINGNWEEIIIPLYVYDGKPHKLDYGKFAETYVNEVEKKKKRIAQIQEDMSNFKKAKQDYDKIMNELNEWKKRNTYTLRYAISKEY